MLYDSASISEAAKLQVNLQNPPTIRDIHSQKFTETFVNKFRKVWWGCLPLQPCTGVWLKHSRTPLQSSSTSPPITSRLDHRTRNAGTTNWHIHRFPQRRGKIVFGGLRKGEGRKRGGKFRWQRRLFSAGKGKYWNCCNYGELPTVIAAGYFWGFWQAGTKVT